MGLLNYLRKYIPNLSTIMAPLYSRLKSKGETFVLSLLELKVIEQLKCILTSYNVLLLPNPNKPFVITISYTPFGYGAALLQDHLGDLRPVGFRSKVLDLDVDKP